jgi:hypothetical protein
MKHNELQNRFFIFGCLDNILLKAAQAICTPLRLFLSNANEDNQKKVLLFSLSIIITRKNYLKKGLFLKNFSPSFKKTSDFFDSKRK